MRLLAVSVPELEDGRAEAQRRIAMRVGAFFGVDSSDTTGLVWVCDYDSLTLAEIARGGPMPVHRDDELFAKKDARGTSSLLPKGWWVVDRALVQGTGKGTQVAEESVAVAVPKPAEIAASTLNRFDHDRKAGAVLRGANTLFQRPTSIVQEVLEMATRSGASDHALLVLWAFLVLTAYDSQPALFAAAAQARGIQRAYAASWRPVVGLVASGARTELGAHGSSDPSDGPLEESDLDLIDKTFPEGVCAPTIDADGEMVAGGQTQVDDLIHQLLRNLLHSDFRPYSWVTEPVPGKRMAHSLAASLDQAAALLDSQFGVATPESFRAEAWERHVPRLVSGEELAALDAEVARVYIWAHLGLCRLLRNRAAEQPLARLAVSPAIEELDRLAETVLGPLDPVRLCTRLRWLEAHRADLRDRRDSRENRDSQESIRASLDEEIASVERGLFRCMNDLVRQFRAGNVDSGLLASTVSTAAPTLRNILMGVKQPTDLVNEYTAVLRDAWDGFEQAIGFDLRAELSAIEQGSSPSPALEAVAPDLHNYLTYRASPQSGADTEEVARIVGHLSGFMIVARRRRAEARANEKTLRLSYQVALTSISKLLATGQELDANVREGLVERSNELTRTLVGFSAVRRYLTDDGALESRTARTTLSRVLDGWLLSYERGGSPLVPPDRIWLQLTRLVEGAGLAFDDDPQGRPPGQRTVLDLVARWRALGFAEPTAHATGTPLQVHSASGDEHGWTARATSDDPTLFRALRGAERSVLDEPILFEVRWREDSHMLSVELPAGAVHERVAYLIATITPTGGKARTLAMDRSNSGQGRHLVGARSLAEAPAPDELTMSITVFE